MSVPRMHADEVPTSAALVRRLVAAQLPRWAGLPVARVPSAGTDNALYRLGADRVVRLPRIHWAARQPEREHRWLPRLAPHLPLHIPEPVALGEPGEGYPWRWSVHRWIDGETATADRIADPRGAAVDLARFVAALQRIDASDGPAPSPDDSARGQPLAAIDAETRRALAALAGTIDVAAATAAWDAALAAPPWRGPPVWVHGDLQSGNLLAAGGRLVAVIDFGCMGVGDPACDVMTAWLHLDAETRGAFREALAPDDATWARARGWALSVGLVALPYYRTTNPALAGIARRAIDRVLADHPATTMGTSVPC